MLQAEADRVRSAIVAAREAGIEAFIAGIVGHGSYLKIGFHERVGRRTRETVGRYERGRLYLSRVAHRWVTNPPSEEADDPEADNTRFHDHIYLGCYGRYPDHRPAGIDADARAQDGNDPCWPVDLGDSFTQALHIAGGMQEAALEESGCSTLNWPHCSSRFWPHPGRVPVWV